jgi:hypothetical protein
MSDSKAVFTLRKEGRWDEALAMAREGYAANANDIWMQRAYGWVLYDLIKHAVQEFEDKQIPPGRLANQLNTWLREYHQFGANERPGMLHSNLLQQVVKASHVWPSFLKFARWWGPEYFTEEDRKPFSAAGWRSRGSQSRHSLCLRRGTRSRAPSGRHPRRPARLGRATGRCRPA